MCKWIYRSSPSTTRLRMKPIRLRDSFAATTPNQIPETCNLEEYETVSCLLSPVFNNNLQSVFYSIITLNACTDFSLVPVKPCWLCFSFTLFFSVGEHGISSFALTSVKVSVTPWPSAPLHSPQSSCERTQLLGPTCFHDKWV